MQQEGAVAVGWLRWRRLLHRVVWLCRSKPLGTGAGVVILALVLVAVFAPLISPYDPQALVARRYEPPSRQFLMGGDQIGRDVASRVIWGARVSLFAGTVATGIGVFLGVVVGVTAGYVRGVFDLMTQRFIDIMLAFPTLLLGLVLVAILGASMRNVITALVVVFLPSVARVIRSSALSVSERPYVDAARAIGCSDIRILLRHVVPNLFSIVIILFSINVAFAILTESSLSFLGAGVPPEVPSWGGMLTWASKSSPLTAPWIAIYPGIALSITVLALNLVGDFIRDILDPKLRGR